MVGMGIVAVMYGGGEDDVWWWMGMMYCGGDVWWR